jgi:hypothetical protein
MATRIKAAGGNGGLDQPSGHRHQGQFAHGDAGQEFGSGREVIQELAREQGTGRVKENDNAHGAGTDGGARNLVRARAETQDRSRCATWARSMSADGTSRSPASRSRKFYSRRRRAREGRSERKYQVEQMYAQYFLVEKRRGKLPLLMWHGGGLTGATYETKPDGNPGWAQLFLRAGWDIYIPTRWSAAARAGPTGSRAIRCSSRSAICGSVSSRASGSRNDDKAKRVIYPGVQFPLEAYEQFMKQGVPRWVTTDEQIVAAYIELVDKVSPCVVLVPARAARSASRWPKRGPTR